MGVASGVSGGGFSIGDDVGKGVMIKSGSSPEEEEGDEAFPDYECTKNIKTNQINGYF